MDIKRLSCGNPCGVYYDPNVYPAPLLTASNVAAVCAFVLLASVVVDIMAFRRAKRPTWNRVTPMLCATVSLAAAITAHGAGLAYTGYLRPGLAPDAPADDWYAQIGQAAMDRMAQQIQIYGAIAVALVVLTLVLVFAWGVLLQVHAVSQRRP